MARKNKRARANYLRKDYRKGGRVGFDKGGHTRKDQRTPEDKAAGYPPEYTWSPHDPNEPGHDNVTPRAGDNTLRDIFDEERRSRVTETGRTATDIAQGILPPQAVPTPDVAKISQEGTTAEAARMVGDTSITGQTMGRTTPETATTISDIGQARDPNQVQAATIAADLVSQVPEIQSAIGQLSPEAIAQVNEIRNLSGPAAASQIAQSVVDSSKANTVDAIISTGAYVPQVSGIAGQVSDTPDAELQTRNAITGQAATGEAAQIINTLGFEASQRSSVQGTARTGAAATMIAETSAIPEDIAAAIVEDPATMEAQIANEDVTVQAAVAALPTEALMSAQMESLVGGLESGNIPAWAKPAVDMVSKIWLKED